jgi:hypothetical protein
MTDTSKQAPAVSQALLDYLIRLYPDRCPDPAETDREVWMAAGAAKVVRKLRSVFEEQSKHNVLETR